MHNTKSQIKLKAEMLKASLCLYSNAYILHTGTISVANMAAADADPNNENKEVIPKSCAQFTDYMSDINKILVDNAKDIDVVMLS